MLVHPSVARFINGWGRASFMSFTVDLDRKARAQAGEIETEQAGRLLLAKFKPTGTFSQLQPEEHFRQAHFTP